MKQTYYDVERTRVICDTCRKEKYFNSVEFKSINKELKERGWRVKQNKGHWVDYCCEKCEIQGEIIYL